jgi:hypothetical protein
VLGLCGLNPASADVSVVIIPTRSKGGRIIFEVALDWSEEKQGYRDMLRLWVSQKQQRACPLVMYAGLTLCLACCHALGIGNQQ